MYTQAYVYYSYLGLWHVLCKDASRILFQLQKEEINIISLANYFILYSDCHIGQAELLLFPEA